MLGPLREEATRIELHAVEPDWAATAALLEQAWRMRAGKRAVAAYDARYPVRRHDPRDGDRAHEQ